MCKKLEIKSGDVYGRLTIIKEVDPRITPSGSKHRMVLVQCSCGNSEPFEVRLDSLKSGNTTSCGCYKKEKDIERGKATKKYNTYDLSGEYGKGYTQKGEEFLFDKEDFDKIKDYCWRLDSNGYVVVYDANTKKLTYMHRIVMNAKDEMVIDHRFHVTNDNRKSQLRECTRSQNDMNRMATKRNSSGVVGVCWHKASNKWKAQIGVNGKMIYLGLFTTKEEAIQARKNAEIKYFGEFRNVN